MVPTESPRLVPLKQLMPLYPWKTAAPPFPENQHEQYMKVKDGDRVFWAPKRMLNHGANDSDMEIPYEGVFEFIDKCIVKNVKRWIDRLVGEIFGLPKYDPCKNRFRR